MMLLVASALLFCACKSHQFLICSASLPWLALVRRGLKVKTESALFGLPEWCQNVPLGALKHVAECGGTTPVGVAGAGDFAQGSPAPQEAAADAAAAKAEGADADAKVTGVHEEPGATGSDANPKASANPTSADATGSEILP